MREFNLQRAFPGLGAAAEDFQYQAGTVENLGVPGLLEIALLDRRQRAIHHHQFNVAAVIWPPGACSASAIVRSMARAKPTASSSRASELRRTRDSACASRSPR